VKLPLETYRAWIAARLDAGEAQLVRERIQAYRTHHWDETWDQEVFADWLAATLEDRQRIHTRKT